MPSPSRPPIAPNQRTTRTLLIVGPQPPPLGGATLTLRALLEELERHTQVRAALVDTRFATTYGTRRLPLTAARRTGLILRDYARQVSACDAVLVFGNNAFMASLLVPLFVLARYHRKPFYLKPIGGDLDLYLAALPRPARSGLLRVLRSLDGILAQTEHLCAALARDGCANSRYLPGWRPASSRPAASARPAQPVKLIYLSQIKPEKGVFVLLEALQQLARVPGPAITCDFYGPIYAASEALFHQQLGATPGARYCGAAQAGSATELIAAYDMLVLPTYFQSEGHPGVLVEAMQAGVPAISTLHRAIPELIRHGENGLLVPVRDSRALAEAIRRLAADPALRARLGAANYRRGQQFRADVVVPRLLDLIFPHAPNGCTQPAGGANPASAH